MSLESIIAPIPGVLVWLLVRRAMNRALDREMIVLRSAGNEDARLNRSFVAHWTRAGALSGGFMAGSALVIALGRVGLPTRNQGAYVLVAAVLITVAGLSAGAVTQRYLLSLRSGERN